jgi:hypothetical protein
MPGVSADDLKAPGRLDLRVRELLHVAALIAGPLRLPVADGVCCGGIEVRSLVFVRSMLRPLAVSIR